MVPSTDLASLMRFITRGFVFTQERYPNGDLSTPEKTRAFAVRHLAVHMAKTVGMIATQAEAYDHGGYMHDSTLRLSVAKMLVNTLKLASELEMTSEDLAASVANVINAAN